MEDLIFENGVWKGPFSNDVSYPGQGGGDCYSIEDESYWFQFRNEYILKALKCFPPESPVFDLGGGNGFVTKFLCSSGHQAVLVEPSEDSVLNAKNRGVEYIINSKFDKNLFKKKSVPAFGLFDVLEHIEDDTGFLQDIRNSLKEDGLLFLTVPALNSLWSVEDTYAGHFRRYNRQTLSCVLKETGYEVCLFSYMFFYLVIPIFLLRRLPYLLGGNQKTRRQMESDHLVSNIRARKILNFLHQSEIKKAFSKSTVSIGSSCIAVARAKK